MSLRAQRGNLWELTTENWELSDSRDYADSRRLEQTCSSAAPGPGRKAAGRNWELRTVNRELLFSHRGHRGHRENSPERRTARFRFPLHEPRTTPLQPRNTRTTRTRRVGQPPWRGRLALGQKQVFGDIPNRQLTTCYPCRPASHERRGPGDDFRAPKRRLCNRES